MSPCLVTGKFAKAEQVQVQRQYLEANGIRMSETPDLLNNLVGESVSGRDLFFRDLPEVWAALGVTASEAAC